MDLGRVIGATCPMQKGCDMPRKKSQQDGDGGRSIDWAAVWGGINMLINLVRFVFED